MWTEHRSDALVSKQVWAPVKIPDVSLTAGRLLKTWLGTVQIIDLSVLWLNWKKTINLS